MLVLLAALYWAILHQRGLRFAPSMRCARIPVVRPCLSPVCRAQHAMCRKGACVRLTGFSHRVGAFSLFGSGLYNAFGRALWSPPWRGLHFALLCVARGPGWYDHETIEALVGFSSPSYSCQGSSYVRWTTSLLSLYIRNIMPDDMRILSSASLAYRGGAFGLRP
jgi:hypothetical protein